MAGRRIALVVNALTDGELKGGNRDSSRIFTLLTDPDLGMCEGPAPLHDCKRKSDFQATLDAILKTWNTDDQLVFYFSGHGHSRHRIYQLQFGRDGTDSIPFKNLLTDVLSFGVTRAILIIDACHSGGALNEKSSFIPLPEEEIPRGIAILTSSRASEKSFELANQSGSVFTKLLCDGIEQGVGPTTDGYISVADIVQYVNDRLKTEEYTKYPQRSLYRVNDADRAVWIARNRSGAIPAPSSPAVPTIVRSLDELRVAYERTAHSRLPCEGALVDDLDWKLVELYIEKSREQLELDRPRKEILRHLGLFSPILLAQEPVLHNAAILCFCSRPERFIPQARCVFVVGDPAGAEFQRTDIFGPLSLQVKQLVELVQSHLVRLASITDSGLRHEEVEIPIHLIREILSNAFVHRDYTLTGTVRVWLTPEALEVQNPGRFPHGASWEMLLSERRASYPVDPAIALYVTNLLAFEGIGRGFDVIRQYISENDTDCIRCTESENPPTVSVRITRRASASYWAQLAVAGQNYDREMHANRPHESTVDVVEAKSEQDVTQTDQGGQKVPVFKLTMLGSSGVGKSTFMAAMYARLRDSSLSGISIRAIDDRSDLELGSIMESVYTYGEWPIGTSVDSKKYEFELLIEGQAVARIDWVDYRGGVLLENPETNAARALVQRLRDSHAILWMVDMTRLSRNRIGGLRERIESGVARMAHLCRLALEQSTVPHAWIFVRTKSDLVQDEEGRPDPERAVNELIEHLGATIEIALHDRLLRVAAVAVSSVGRVTESGRVVGDDPMLVEWPLLLSLAFLMDTALADQSISRSGFSHLMALDSETREPSNEEDLSALHLQRQKVRRNI